MARWMTLLFFLIVTAAIGGTNGLTIKAVQARLFYHYSGTLSDTVTGKETFWNTIIGEGEAHEPSTATFVDVIVSGKGGDYQTAWMIELVVKSGVSGKVLSKQTEPVGVLNDAGTFHVPFWIKNTGCEKLIIRARIKGSNAWTETMVPFNCGE